MEAHKIRVARGDPNIAEVHLADAIENLTRERRESLSDDRDAEGSVRAKEEAQGAGKGARAGGLSAAAPAARLESLRLAAGSSGGATKREVRL